jgi:hypothetical protein
VILRPLLNFATGIWTIDWRTICHFMPIWTWCALSRIGPSHDCITGIARKINRISQMNGAKCWRQHPTDLSSDNQYDTLISSRLERDPHAKVPK